MLLGQLDAIMQVLLLFVRFANSGPSVDYEGQLLTHLSVVGSYIDGQIETQLWFKSFLISEPAQDVSQDFKLSSAYLTDG